MIKRNSKGQFVKGYKNRLGIQHTETTKKKMKKSQKKRFQLNPMSKETILKRAEKIKGKPTWNKGIKGYKVLKTSGKKNHNWKGGKVGYDALHDWVKRQKGKANNYQCKFCNNQAEQWANKDHKYKRNLNDFMALCISCHRKYDKKLNL